MELVAGQLKRIGNGSSNMKKRETEYSFIEIDKRVFNDVKIDNGLQTVFEDGLKTDRQIKFWLAGSKIMALQIDGEDRYYSKLPKGTWFSVIFMWLFFGVISAITFSTLKNAWWAAFLILFVPILFFWDIKKYFDAASEGGRSV